MHALLLLIALSVEPQAATPSSVASPVPNASPSPSPDDLMKHLSVGASVSNASSTTATKPYIDVEADFPVAIQTTKAYPPIRIRVETQLGGTAAQTGVPLANQLAAGDLSGFYSVSFQGSAHYVVGNSASARSTVSFQAGVSSVLGSGPVQPTTANPGHAEFCFGFWKKDHSASFNVCPVGVSNEVGDPSTVGRVDGRVTIGGSVPLRFQVSVIYPYGNAPSNWYSVGTVHNVLTTVAVSYDFDKVVQAPNSPSPSASYRPWHHAAPTV